MSLLVMIATVVVSTTQPNKGDALVMAEAQPRDCSRAVAQILSQHDGRLLSILAHGDRCTVIVLIYNEGQRPEKKVLRVTNEFEQIGGS